jgi:succinate-acetate transporter protein
LKKTKISIFGGISRFRLWADFGSYGQFWAEFAAMAVADSMPELWLKFLKSHNF